MDVKKYKYIYLFLDYVSAFIAWNLFDVFRHILAGYALFQENILQGITAYPFLSSISVPFFWLILYYSSGYYNNPLRKTRLEDLRNSIVQSFIGVCILSFLSFFNLKHDNYGTQFNYFLIFLLVHFLVTVLFRITFTSFIIHLKNVGKIYFRTLIMGRLARITPMISELNTKYPGHGHRFVGYIPVETENQKFVKDDLLFLGHFEELHDVIIHQRIEDIIIVLNENDLEIYKQILVMLNSSHVELKVNTELYPVIKGKVNISSLFQYPLIQVSRDLVPIWHSITKNALDIFGAFLGLLITAPVSLVLIVLIKTSSEGPVIYSHERIGRFGKPFRIYKFRSMIRNAEIQGPQLATKDDPRITKLGHFMRRLRLDEIPNFINVLKGDMSLVGPRPERKYYIDQIIEKAPEYKRLLQVKPGVTSWGQVKYGYAENIEEMIRRMRYDLLYIENISLYVDIQILVRTVIIILKGRGI